MTRGWGKKTWDEAKQAVRGRHSPRAAVKLASPLEPARTEPVAGYWTCPACHTHNIVVSDPSKIPERLTCRTCQASYPWEVEP